MVVVQFKTRYRTGIFNSLKKYSLFQYENEHLTRWWTTWKTKVWIVANIDRSSRQDKKKLAKLFRLDRLVALPIIGSIHSINQCMGIYPRQSMRKSVAAELESSVSFRFHFIYTFYLLGIKIFNVQLSIGRSNSFSNSYILTEYN